MVLNVNPSGHAKIHSFWVKWNIAVTTVSSVTRRSAAERKGSERWKSDRRRQRFVFTLINGV